MGNEIQEYIIKKLIHNPNMRFNELLDKKFESNKFSYHIKQLEAVGLIEKKDETYSLSHEGKKYSTFIEGNTGAKAKAPLSAVIMFAIKGDKVLLMKRLKEPFYGCSGGHGGKIKFNQYPDECAKEEFKEETGLDADVELKGIYLSKTYNNKKQSYNHQFYIYLCTNLEGELIEKDREGENYWIEISKIYELYIFPDVPKLIEMCTRPGFTVFEADRHQENDEFKNMVIRKHIQYS